MSKYKQPQRDRPKIRCCTEFTAKSPDGGTVVSKCGTDFFDSTVDFGSGFCIKRGITKITKQGIYLLCPRCKRHTLINKELTKNILSVIEEYLYGVGG